MRLINLPIVSSLLFLACLDLHRSMNMFAPSLPNHLRSQVTQWNALSLLLLFGGLPPPLHDVFELPALRLTTFAVFPELL